MIRSSAAAVKTREITVKTTDEHAPVYLRGLAREMALKAMEAERHATSRQSVPVNPCEVWVPDNAVLATDGEEPEYIELEVVLDPGAGLHVANKKHVPGFSIVPTALSRAGAGFIAANGGTMDNLGEVALDMMTEDGKGGVHHVASKFQVADVTRALWSVGVICDAGLRATFSAHEAVVHKPDGTPICHFQRTTGLYIAKTRVRNPKFQGFRRPGM